VVGLIAGGLLGRFGGGFGSLRGSLGLGRDGGHVNDREAPAAKIVFLALVLAGKNIAHGVHQEMERAGSIHVRADGAVPGFGGRLGLLVQVVGGLVIGIGGGGEGSQQLNVFDAIERTICSQCGVLEGDRLRQGDELIRVFRNRYSHGMVVLLVVLISAVPKSDFRRSRRDGSAPVQWQA